MSFTILTVVRFPICILLLLTVSTQVRCEDNTAREVERAITKSVQTLQATEQEQERWDAEEQELLALYDTLIQEQKSLKSQSEILSRELEQRQDSVDALKVRQKENDKITREIEPFLEQVYSDLNEFVLKDMPFLHEERTERMVRLKQVMDNIDLPVTEKFRKVMESLSVEAEYGNTIEVNRSAIEIQGKTGEVVADIFRLGRISMFALTLDHSQAAFYDVADNRWVPLGAEYLNSISGAVQMAGRQRTVDILSIPIGRINIP